MGKVKEATKALEEARRHYDQLKAQYDLSHVVFPTNGPKTPDKDSKSDDSNIKPAIKPIHHQLQPTNIQPSKTKKQTIATTVTYHSSQYDSTSYQILTQHTNSVQPSSSTSDKKLPNTGTNSDNDGKAAFIGYAILVTLGLIGLVTPRKRN